MLKILIIDDHQLFTDALAMTLRAQLPNVQIEHSDNAKHYLLNSADLSSFDVLIVDISMPDISGITFLELTKQVTQNAKTIICSGSLDHQTVAKIKSLNLHGVIDKSESIHQLIAAIKHIVKGGTYYSAIYKELLSAPSAGKHSLSPQQASIVGLMDQGKSNKEIAKVLSLSPNTVKTHLRILYDKLDVNSRTACLQLLRQQGLI